MPTSDNFSDTIIRVAPAGAVVAGTVYADATDKVVCLAMTTAASGANFTAKVTGKVRSVLKVTGSAWTAGQRLIHDATAFTVYASGLGVVIAHAAVAAASADATGDVILELPNPLSA